jgi:tripartite-type tricarboxylate transporter receptor subunit TctC
MTTVLPYLNIGKLRALGMTGTKRSPMAPDVPTISEAGVPGYQASIWNGMMVPAGTPASIVEKLNGEIVRILNSLEMRERFAGMGADVSPCSPEEMRAFIESEIKAWSKVIRETGIRSE